MYNLKQLNAVLAANDKMQKKSPYLILITISIVKFVTLVIFKLHRMQLFGTSAQAKLRVPYSQTVVQGNFVISIILLLN